ncbi:hypothetical protein GCM10028832_08670 [Streptomyces sparsus]
MGDGGSGAVHQLPGPCAGEQTLGRSDRHGSEDWTRRVTGRWLFPEPPRLPGWGLFYHSGHA